MTRQEYILATKAKLDEISPFDEPNHFIAAQGDPDYEEVKPIVSYIEECLDKAGWFCLNSLPVSLLLADVETDRVRVQVDDNGVGHLAGVAEYFRLVNIKDKSGWWKRNCGSFITSQSPLYLLQENAYVRGGACKPMAVLVPERAEVELYSFPKGEATIEVDLSYINCHKKAEEIEGNVSDFVVLRCASLVGEILGDPNIAQVFTQEFANKLTGILA